MATSTTKILCRYFSSGACTKGDLCPFSHNWKDKPDMTCRYYLMGTCSYGANCRYDHVRLKESKEDGVKSKRTPSGPVSLPSLASSISSGTGAGVGGGSGGRQGVVEESKLVTLKKDPSKTPKQWVQAPEFVPGRRFHGKQTEEQEQSPQESLAVYDEYYSYSDVAGAGVQTEFLDVITAEEAASLLCPFAEMGICPFGESCEYLHGEICDMCNRQCLNPFDPEQQKAHHQECLEMHQREMEKAFAAKESEGKTCGICMEIIVAKLNRSERRFGILSDCEHCFCLGCIRKWRGSTHTKKKTIRACPLCRTVSFFVVPSEVWLEDPEQKKQLIEEYKSNMGKKHCKYFNKGEGTCPFGGSCFYRHDIHISLLELHACFYCPKIIHQPCKDKKIALPQLRLPELQLKECIPRRSITLFGSPILTKSRIIEYPDGTKAEIIPRFYSTAEGDTKVIRDTMLWEFFEEREERPLNPPPVTNDWDGSDSSD